MIVYMDGEKYVPGTYARKRPDAAQLASRFIKEWDEKRLEGKAEVSRHEMPPAISFSRKIGVGALEIADIVAEKTGCRVVDRELLEHIAGEAQLNKKTVALFDERYPGLLEELLSMALTEKAFIESDYARHLFSAVFFMASSESTIFVGRGTHLILPRDRVLAVRLISSKEHRVKRLARILMVDERESRSKLEQVDKEQRDFFKKVYGKRDASPYEFDLVINCDYLGEPQWAAEIIATAFREKFALLNP
ncbi:MAG: cytidylate kinase-like family protein [Pseudomonadota bacterium]